jgi:hypothetical protein
VRGDILLTCEKTLAENDKTKVNKNTDKYNYLPLIRKLKTKRKTKNTTLSE